MPTHSQENEQLETNLLETMDEELQIKFNTPTDTVNALGNVNVLEESSNSNLKMKEVIDKKATPTPEVKEESSNMSTPFCGMFSIKVNFCIKIFMYNEN